MITNLENSVQIGSLSMYLAAVLIAYLIFIFISERVNPFSKPNSYKNPSLSRWRFARTIAVVFFICSFLGLYASELFSVSRTFCLSISTVLFGIFWATKGTKRIIRRNKAFAIAETPANTSVKQRTEQSNLVDKEPNVTEAESKVEIDQSFESPAEQLGSNSEYILKKNTDEHKLEMELAVARVPPDLSGLDQSVVEAEFESIHGSAGASMEFSSPDFSVEDFVAGVASSKEAANHRNNHYFDKTVDFADILDEVSADTKNSLSVELLRKKYQNLLASNDYLMGELAKLKVTVNNSQAAKRKSEAARDHAVLLKTKALEIAAMERKKRRLTEIKASKVIMKLRRNLELQKTNSQQVLPKKTAAPQKAVVLNKSKAVS